MKVYSTALFGNRYQQYLPTFTLAACNLFPRSEGWQVRIHTDDEFLNTDDGALLLRLFAADLVEMRVRDAAPLTKAMLWRVAPVFEPGVSHVFCRDIDALPMPRDRVVCDQFIRSEAAIGTCHDNVAHIGIMGGLCHFNVDKFIAQSGIKTMDELYAFAGSVPWQKHGVDQDVLNRLISARPSLTLLEHRYAGWKDGMPGKTDREAGVYDCQAWSTPTSNLGFCSRRGDYAALLEADRLAPHLGSAGYDIDEARSFWEAHGDPAIARIVHSCEMRD